MKRHKAYRFRLYPTVIQQEKINRNIGCVRFVHNFLLAEQRKEDAYWRTSTYDVTYNFESSAKRQRQERPGLFIFTSRTDPCQIPTEMVKVGQGNPWCLPCFPWVGCDNAPENHF